MKKASKFLLALFGLVLIVGLTACGNNDDTPADTATPPVEEAIIPPAIDEDTTIADLIAEFGLPAPRFEADPSTPSWVLDSDRPLVELDWYVNFIWWPIHTSGDSWVTYEMMNDMNVRINWTSGNDEALNAMLAGGDLPDIITFGGHLTAISSDAPLWALPLDVLATVYDPYFLSIFPEQMQNWMRLPNGHFYGIMNEGMTSDEINAGLALPGTGFLVRGDIYEAIGSPDMTTPEGFLQALRDAREAFPTDDHGRPLVAFSPDTVDVAGPNNGALSGFLQDFLAIPTTNPDGTYYDRDSNPEYLEWLLTFRQAFEEGLMSPEFDILPNEDINNLFQTGNFFAVMTGNTNDFSSRMNEIANSDTPEQQMIAITGPRNAAGDPHTFAAGGINGWTHTFITNSTNDPQTAIQVLTYFWSDYGQMVQQFGREGVTYSYVDGVPTLLPEIQEFLSTDYYGFRDEWGIRTFWQLRRPGFFAGQGVLPTGPHADVQLHNRQFNQARLNFVALDPTPATDEMAHMQLGVINTARTQALVGVVTAATEQEARDIWADFLAFRDNNGFSGILEYRNNRLRINNERLGL